MQIDRHTPYIHICRYVDRQTFILHTLHIVNSYSMFNPHIETEGNIYRDTGDFMNKVPTASCVFRDR